MWYDILVVCILLFFLVRGAARGLIWQLASIAGILLCVTFASTASTVIGPHINLAPPTNQWAVMFITYLLASFVAFGFARVLNGWIEKLELKEYNRHLGAVFGLVKGALLVLILTFMIVTFSEKTRGMLKESKAAQIAAKAIHQIEPIVPDKLHGAVAKYIRMFENTGFVRDSSATDTDTEILPDEAGNGVDPMGETELGQSEPFDPFNLSRPTSKPRSTRSTDVTDQPEEVTDLATELRKTVGSKVSRLIEDELRAASPKVKARIEQNITDALQSADRRSKLQLQERLLSDGQQSSLSQLVDDWAADVLATGDAAPPQRPPGADPRNTTSRTPSRPTSGGSTAPAPRSPENPVPASNGKRTVLDEIVSTKSQFASIQKKLKAEYTQVLQMLPAEVSRSVLDDWYGDLTNSSTDVDPETDSTTPLDGRIIRQLKAARYAESKLDPELQSRLKQFRLTAEGAGVLR